MPRNDRRRNFTLTLYGKDRDEVIGICNREKVTYAIFGREVCPTTGRKHLQGFVRFKNGRTFAGLKQLFGNDAHIEAAVGTPYQNYEYCSKDADFAECGQRPTDSRRRKDLDAIKEDILSGKTIRSVIPKCSNQQAIRFAETLCKYMEPSREEEMQVYWYYGPTGTGKTRSAFAEANAQFPNDVWCSGTNIKWWDGYDGHSAVILDDLRSEDVAYQVLLRILDRYPLRVEVKGGFRQLRAAAIWITCPYSPESFFTGEDSTQLVRRVTVSREFLEIED